MLDLKNQSRRGMDCDRRVDCEFTLALNNRTGKYFLCRDMLDASADLIDRQFYWRLAFAKVPSRNLSRLLGRLARIEIDFRTRHPLVIGFCRRCSKGARSCLPIHASACSTV